MILTLQSKNVIINVFAISLYYMGSVQHVIKEFDAGHFFAFECDEFPGYFKGKLTEFLR